MDKEYGRVGANRCGGSFFEEFLPELRGGAGIKIYREMSDNDDTVGAILFAIKMLIRQAVTMLNTASATVESLRAKMNETAAQLPEYPVVMEMDGVGSTLGPQLIAEIGDVTRFKHRGALTAFAGVDPRPDESGDYKRKSNPTSKKGSPHLRKTLFQIMDGLIQRSPVDNPVYAFMDKKRAQGKPYYVYMTAGANKFLRIYYARVKECMAALEAEENTEG